MSELFLAIDQGTSATKACVFEPPARLVGQAKVAVSRSSPEADAVEQDPEELVESCSAAASEALRAAGARGADLRSCALANTGESFVLFDRSGRAVTPVIGWQDGRVGERLEALMRAGDEPRIKGLTGLPLHAEFTAPKLDRWLRLAGPADSLHFGTLDTWLTHRLAPERPFVTDRATASRTMLIALDDEDWTDELLADFDVPRDVLAEVRPCDAMDLALRIDGADVPLGASGYDMGLALLGHACLRPGETKATFGTCLGVMTATDATHATGDGLLSAIAYTRGAEPALSLDGEIASAGALVQWAVGLGIAESREELDALASSVPSSRGAVIVPAISGLGAPHWRDDVEARIVGLDVGVGRAQLCRAVYDAIALSLADVITALTETGLAVDEIQVDGGLTHSRTLMGLCADACQLPLVRIEQTEATAFGAAALAMLTAGAVGRDELKTAVLEDATTIDPGAGPDPALRERWDGAIAEALAR